MQITKFVHSCLLVETPARVGIIDPGQFSWDSGLFDVAKLSRLDDIIITHEHEDHMSIAFIQSLLAAFPNARITTTAGAQATLAKAGIEAHTAPTANIEFLTTPHESVAPLGVAPDHVAIHYLGQLTHGGDSHHITETKHVLALAVTAPWGTLMRAAELGAMLKPKTIIPIHDWHWNDTARTQAYNRLEAFFTEHGIAFIKPIDDKKFSV